MTSSRSPRTVPIPIRLCRSTALLPALLLAPFSPSGPHPVQDWYVDGSAPACATGTGSAADPFCSIMDAVMAAVSGDTIHIAPGTYFENVVLDRDLHLIGAQGADVTIVDGSLSGSVVSVGLTSVVGLTGLTLTHGSQSGLFFEDLWGIPDSLPRVTLEACRVIDNSEGGVYCVSLDGNSAPDGALTVTGSTVSGNAGTDGGFFSACRLTILDSTVSENSGVHCGGILSQLGDVSVTSSIIRGNTASALSTPLPAISGGIAVWYGACDITNSLLLGNSAFSDGPAASGGIAGTRLNLSNSSVIGNVASSTVPFSGPIGGVLGMCPGGGLVGCRPTNTVTNCILVDNTPGQTGPDGFLGVLGYSLVQGGHPGPGNIDSDPLFVDALGLDGLQATGDEDYRLLPSSPCIDAGDNAGVPLEITTDMRGMPRFLDDPLTPDTGRSPRWSGSIGMGPRHPALHGTARGLRTVVDIGPIEFSPRALDARGHSVNGASPRVLR